MGMTLDSVVSIRERSKNFKVSFTHLGHAHRAVRTCLLELDGALLFDSPRAYLDADPTNDQFVIILGVEGLAAGSVSMGVLRERVFREMELGSYFSLISGLPKNEFPVTPGSDLIADAKQVFVEETGDAATCTGCPSTESHIQACLADAGTEAIEELSTRIWEGGDSPLSGLNACRRSSQNAFRGTGLVKLDGDRLAWTDWCDQREIRSKIAFVSAASLDESSALSAVYGDLWFVERLLRNTIRGALVERSGASWKTSLGNDGLLREILERAQADSHPMATSVKELRDPLEWLTTTELLDLRESLSLGELGMPKLLWRRIRTEVVPLRNRVAHMRLISQNDAVESAMWRKVVRKHLS